MPQPAGESCGTCRYYNFVLEHSQYCQRHPPQVYGSSQAWPSVKPTDWCGEWSVATAQHAKHKG